MFSFNCTLRRQTDIEGDRQKSRAAIEREKEREREDEASSVDFSSATKASSFNLRNKITANKTLNDAAASKQVWHVGMVGCTEGVC